MLVLMRRVGESLRINEDIEVKVLKIQGGKTYLGIEAPKKILVYREEVYKRLMDSDSSWDLNSTLEKTNKDADK